MKRTRMYAHISSAGITLFAAVIIGILIGQFLDEKVGTTGIFTLLFVILGSAGGVVNLLRVVGKLSNERDESDTTGS